MAEEKKDEILEETQEPVAEEAVEETAEEKTVSAEEYASMYDKYLRTIAEFDNYKKRTQKEKEEIYSIAKADVVLGLLPVIDNFERAEKFSEDKNGTHP